MLNWPWGMHLLAVIAKQSKSAFLSELKSQGPSNVQGTVTTGKGRPLQPTTPLQFATVDSHQRDCPPTSQWSVVQEDFMLGREKLKGWDQVKIVFHQEHRKLAWDLEASATILG
jgi:hypothetical protein